MTAAAWWAAAVVGMSAMMVALLLVSDPSPPQLTTGLAGIALLLLAWFGLGAPRAANEIPSASLVGLVATATGLAVAAAPSLAIAQAVAYPIAWVFARSMRAAVVGNLTVATSVAIGFVISLGISPGALAQTGLTMALSLGFSLAMGFWISRMTALGEERGRLLADLQGAQSQIAALNREAGATAEREHLARELHDTIAQDLTALVMLAQRARRELGDVDTLRMIEENARATLAETRALVAAGSALGDQGGGLAATLQRLASRFARETGVEVDCTLPEVLSLSRDAEVVVVRSVQEALANARKHARASRISIIVTIDGERVHVTVTDDGVGFTVGATPEGFGLVGMAERLALVAGHLDVQSAPGAGTRLTAILPMSQSGARPQAVAERAGPRP